MSYKDRLIMEGGERVMATCKECLHVEVCKEYHKMFWGSKSLVDSKIDETEPENCLYFKDRSRFVELPCKHGDTLFRIINGKIEKGVATAFFHWSESHIVNCRFPKINTGIPFHRFGKTVFLSKKEAEQALKECENNV